MLTINVIHRGDEKLLNGTLNGEKFNINFTDEAQEKLVDLQEEYNGFKDGSKLVKWAEKVQAVLDDVPTLDVIETACSDLKKNAETGNYHVVIDGDVSKTAVPEQLVAVILESAEKDIDPTPIVKAWIRFLRNPNFTETKAERFANYITAEIVDLDEAGRLVDEEGFAHDTAVSRSTYNDVAITQEGLIVCKKYAELLTEGWKMDKETNKPVRIPLYGKTEVTVDKITGETDGGEDKLPEFAEELYFQPPMQRTGGDAFFAGDDKGHVILVGKNHTLEHWHQVNTNDYEHCVKGLHVGGWQYVQAYSGLNCQLLECFVDPAEIGAICDLDRDDGAMRVREYFVYGATEGRTKGIYHSSTYAAMKDEEWEEYKKEAVKQANELLDGVQSTLDDLGK